MMTYEVLSNEQAGVGSTCKWLVMDLSNGKFCWHADNKQECEEMRHKFETGKAIPRFHFELAKTGAVK